jgi:hypothetical protein
LLERLLGTNDLYIFKAEGCLPIPVIPKSKTTYTSPGSAFQKSSKVFLGRGSIAGAEKERERERKRKRSTPLRVSKKRRCGMKWMDQEFEYLKGGHRVWRAADA